MGEHLQKTVSGALLVFAKAPVPGKVKTRLIPALGAEGAARLHVRLLRRTLHEAVRAPFSERQLWCVPDSRHPVFGELRQEHDVTLQVQSGRDLGERMHHALRHVLEVHDFAVLVGTDCISLCCDDLQLAGRMLKDRYDVVLAPAEDGGYVLIGLRQPHVSLFTDVPWGESSVAGITRSRIRKLGLRYFELPMQRDIDRPSDLTALPPELLGRKTG